MAKKTNCVINGIPYYRKYATINGKRKMVYGESKKDCERKIDELKKMEALGMIDTKKTVGDAMKLWIYNVLSAKQGIRESTFAIYEGVYRNTIKDDQIMNIPLKDIKSFSVQDYANRLQASGKSSHSVHHSIKVLKMFFRYATDEGYVLRNPCNNISLTPVAKGKGIEVLSAAEIQNILKALEGDPTRFLFALALGTGMRIGELLALRYSDFANNEVTVDKQLQTIRHVTESGITYERKDVPPKTQESNRVIPLSENVVSEYDLHRKNAQALNLRLGRGRLTEDDHIFLTPTGKLWQQGQVQKKWKTVLMLSEIEHKQFHILRHTYITKLIQEGIPIATVMKLAGHSKIETTLRYTHVETEYLKEAMNVIDDLFV